MDELLNALKDLQDQVGEAGMDLIQLGVSFITALKERNPDLTPDDWKLYAMAFENAGATLSALCILEAKDLESPSELGPSASG